MNSEDKQPVNHVTAHLFRENSGKMTAVLSRIYGIENLEIIIDAIQDTFETALLKWRYSGVPDHPAAWLIKVARNKTVNLLKRNTKTTRWIDQDREIITEPDFVFSDDEITDSQLRLLLACCRLKLAFQKKVIVTLHILCGFGTKEIANALLLSDEAVKKALYRAKTELRTQPKQFENPGKDAIRKYRDMMLTVLYLLFNEGHKVTNGTSGINTDLCYEAIRLTKMVREYDVSDRKTNALLALFFFTIARFPARITTTGEWLTLAEQNRKLWDRTFITEGFYYLDRAKPEKELNTYYLEALIASLHSTATDFAHTDWKGIVYLYRQSERLQPESVLLRLNRIVAEMHLKSTPELINEIDRIEKEAGTQNRFIWLMAKAYGSERSGDRKCAEEWYRNALPYAKTEMDRTFILKKLASDT